MLKKITSLFAAGTIAAAGLLVVTAPASSAADVTQTLLCITNNPITGMPASVFSNSIRNNEFMTPEWSASTTPTWSPAVSGNFVSNTVYVATVTLTPMAAQTKFNNLAANVFTSNSSCAGHSSVTSISSPAVAAGANLSTIDITVTFANTGNGGGGVAQTSTATSSNVTDTSITVDWATLAAAHSGVTTWRVYVRDRSVSPSVLIGYYDIAGSVHALTVNGLNAGTQYNFFMADLGGQQMNGYYIGFEPGLNVTTTGTGGAQNNNSQLLAAAQAAAAQAAAAKVAAIAKAQTALVDTFKANKPATLSDMSSSDFAIKQQATVDRINQTVLALQAKNPGVSLPIATIKDVVAKETIVEQISTSVTQGTVQVAQLVKTGFIDPTNSVKSSVMNALKSLDPSTLNSVDKLKAAIAAQTKIAQDRYARTRAIVAKIGARK